MKCFFIFVEYSTKMKKIILLTTLCVLFTTAYSQSDSLKPNPFSANVDLVSSFVWRGQDISMAPNIQPYFAFEKGGFEAGAWASYAVNGTYGEVDLYAAYTKGLFSITLTDYYISPDSGSWNYFNYDSKKTLHAFEGTLGFLGTERVPLSINASVFFYGSDLNEDENPYYSKYIETKYEFKHFDLFCGITPGKGFYNDSFGLVNTGITIKNNVKVNKTLEIPLNISLIANPSTEKVFVVAAVTF